MKKNETFSRAIVRLAVIDACRKLSPRKQLENPVMFLVYVSAVLTTCFYLEELLSAADASGWFTLSIAVLLWFTVLFANFAEAIAEGRGKAQAEALRSAKKEVEARRIPAPDQPDRVR
ncbi:MAG: hypothetical protein LKE51_07850 [Selenomonas sp.]|jgi:K+-transporting ATPase ATPase B chain|nr:hypothetical protein [Selenomonas sp.]